MTVTLPKQTALQHTAPQYTADIDVGGTFTDGFFTDGTTAHRAKVLTTPHDLTECFLGCLRRGAAAFGDDLPAFLGRTQVVRLSTTLGTNTLLQRRGPRVAVLVTAGAEESLYTDGAATAAFRILDQGLVRGIAEEMGADGVSVRPPDAEGVLDAVRDLVRLGARTIAVCLAGSWRNPDHERRVREIVRARYPVHYLRSVPMQLAHEVTASDSDRVRCATVLLNSYLHGDLARGLYRAEDLARAQGMRRPLLIVHAAGGSARVAKSVAVQTLSSGPAVAVRGAAVTARRLGLTHVVTADMGGTSLDIAVLDGTEPTVVPDPEIAGMRIGVPVIATESIGAGGGSIAQVVDGKLQVGPESAGSTPGPVCYGKGGQRPTVTDANLLMGLLSPDDFLGGRMKLDVDRAAAIVERRLSGALGVDVQTAAALVREQINTAMADQVRARLEATGADPGEFTLFAFGGGGPLHACDIAERAGLRRVVGFPHGSVFSAFGSSTVDVWHRYTRGLDVAADDAALPDLVGAVVEDLARPGRLDMRGEGFTDDEVRATVSLVVERDGVRSERELGPQPEAARIRAAAVPGARLREIVLDLRAATPTWTPVDLELSTDPVEPHTYRAVRWTVDGPALRTPVFRLESMPPGSTVNGPAIIDTTDTAYAVNPVWTARRSGYGDVWLERGGVG